MFSVTYSMLSFSLAKRTLILPRMTCSTILVAPKPHTELCPLGGLAAASPVSLAGFPWESHMANIHVMVDVSVLPKERRH